MDTSTEHFADIDLIEEGDIFDDEETDDVSFGCVVCSEIETDLSIIHDSDDNFELCSPHENEPDKLALSLQDVIYQKKLTPDCFMYKILTNVFDYALINQNAKHTFSWDTEVLEFYN